MHAQTCVMRQLVGPRRRGWIPVQCWGIMVEGVSSTVVGGAGKVCGREGTGLGWGWDLETNRDLNHCKSSLKQHPNRSPHLMLRNAPNYQRHKA